jgi:hypothetical protein
LVPRASDPVFKFCAPELLSRGNEGVGSRFQVFPFRTHFQWYRGHRVPFSYFALPNSFSAVPRASAPVFMFCAPGPIFDGTEGVGSLFPVFRARTRFRRYRGRRVPFSSFALYRGRRVPFICFALPDTFSAVPRVSGPVFMFCAPGLVFGGNEGVGSCFHVLRSQSRFPWYRGRQVPFSSFALPESFLAVPWASGLVILFCAPGLILGGTDDVGSRFHILCSRTIFRRYRGRRLPFLSFARLDSFLGVPRASSPIFMFCTPGLIFGSVECVGYRFYVLRARTRF